jgi:hypothetical protein
MEMSKAWDAGRVTVALAPDLDEFGLTAGCDAKSWLVEYGSRLFPRLGSGG